jgi:hypothetical protein
VTAAVILGWLSALVIGRLPRVLHRFMAAFVRTTAHVTAFLYVVGRAFPGFLGREGSYPVDVTIAPPERQRRLGGLLRLVLAVPALLLSSAYAWVLFVVAVLAWVVALVLGRVPDGLRDLGVSALRYQTQITAYLLLLTDHYAYAAPVLRARPAEPVARLPGTAPFALGGAP